MNKTDIIGFCQKIRRIVKLVVLSDTLTQKRCWMHGRFGGWGGYTNDEPLKTNFRFTDPPPPPHTHTHTHTQKQKTKAKKKKKNNKTKSRL